jgi:hypothetical protein
MFLRASALKSALNALNKVKSPRRHITFFVFYSSASQPIDFHSRLIDIQKASIKKQAQTSQPVPLING